MLGEHTQKKSGLWHNIFKTINIRTRVQDVGPHNFAFGKNENLKASISKIKEVNYKNI